GGVRVPVTRRLHPGEGDQVAVGARREPALDHRVPRGGVDPVAYLAAVDDGEGGGTGHRWAPAGRQLVSAVRRVLELLPGDAELLESRDDVRVGGDRHGQRAVDRGLRVE